MTNLYSLQDKFQNYLLQGHNIQDLIVGTKTVPAVTRLAIYREAYQARLLEALAVNYPCLKAYLGHEEFQTIGLAYIDTHPSPYRSIRWFGDELANYLTCCYAQQYPSLSELAEFEWKMTLAFDAADRDVFKMEQMAIIPGEDWARMRFVPHPSVQCMTFFWNVVPIWESVTGGELLPPLPVKNLQSTAWILWRKDYINHFYALSPDESWAINGILNGITFAKLCEGLCSFVDEQDVGMRAATLLKSWIHSGLLSDILLD